jgi:hypothetical protein
MADMIDKIKNNLKSSDEEAQQHSIYLIGYAFEVSRGYDDGNVPDEINDIDVDEEIIAYLKKALIDYLASNPNEKNRASAYNALGKSYGYDLKNYFIEALRDEVEKSPVVAYQIMIAILNLGEDCFNGKQSLSMFDYEENIQSARNYLRSL